MAGVIRSWGGVARAVVGTVAAGALLAALWPAAASAGWRQQEWACAFQGVTTVQQGHDAISGQVVCSRGAYFFPPVTGTFEATQPDQSSVCAPTNTGTFVFQGTMRLNDAPARTLNTYAYPMGGGGTGGIRAANVQRLEVWGSTLAGTQIYGSGDHAFSEVPIAAPLGACIGSDPPGTRYAFNATGYLIVKWWE